MRVFRELANLPVGETDTVYYKEKMEKSKFAFNGEKALFIDHSSASASVIFAAGFRLYYMEHPVQVLLPEHGGMPHHLG